MSEEPTPTPEPQPPVSDSWKEVGKQFAALGKSVGEAIQALWSNEQTQKQVAEVKTGLETMVHEVNTAVGKVSSTPEAQKIKAEAVKAASSAKAAGEQTVQEVRPQLLSALRTLNDEMQRLIDRLEAEPTPPQEPPVEPPAAS
jgi:gas vesicle protein